MFLRTIATVFLLVWFIAAPHLAGAQTGTAGKVGANGYDGIWQGRGTLMAGPAGCPSVVDFKVEVSGDEFTGTATHAGETWDVEGSFVSKNKIEGQFHAPIGTANFTARFRDGMWRGSWDAEGECDGTLYFERAA